MLIHWRKSATTDAGNLPCGGIGSMPSAAEIAWKSRLASTSPGTTAGPDAPPARIAARLSTLRPPLGFFASDEWHSWHFSTRTGRIFASKKATPFGSSPARAAEPIAAMSASEETEERIGYLEKNHAPNCPHDGRARSPGHQESRVQQQYNKSSPLGHHKTVAARAFGSLI